MVSRLAFFKATIQYSIVSFLPRQRQLFLEYIGELSESGITDTCSQSILEVWMEQFEIGGLLLGSIGLFLVPFILMILADVLICHFNIPMFTIVANTLSGLYCLERFHCNKQRLVLNFLLLAYVGTAIFSGFLWTITIIFLVLFSVGTTCAQKRGPSC